MPQKNNTGGERRRSNFYYHPKEGRLTGLYIYYFEEILSGSTSYSRIFIILGSRKINAFNQDFFAQLALPNASVWVYGKGK